MDETPKLCAIAPTVRGARFRPRARNLFKGAVAVIAALASDASYGGTWQALAHQPSFLASMPLLLTDGTVIVNVYNSGQWWRLAPDATGSYVNGTWTQIASMPAGYAPLFWASAVLPDGRVIVEGGEYNSGLSVDTTLGAIYQPKTNSWASVTPPAGWSSIGDAPAVVLANGTFMLGSCCSAQSALLNPTTLTWTTTGSNKADQDFEEGWTLLSSGKVLTVDVANGTQSELYNPSTGSWSLAGSTVNPLVSSCGELGPAVLRPDGTVFATGGTTNTAIYNSGTGVWAGGPSFPAGRGINDGPAAVLPSGNVLFATSPWQGSYCYAAGAQFFEFDGAQFISEPAIPNAASDASSSLRMLVLPTGQVLLTDTTTNVQIYTPTGTYQSSWRPVISSVPSTLTAGSTYTVSGLQLNGVTQGAAYGDDAQMATNYPLVRITNSSTGHVFYARTHDHSTMGVATGSVSTSTISAAGFGGRDA